ncbi:MAG TPA: dihydroorotase [Candidatus Treponema faecavium]|nr:dihydroorotase [Candidatus Treponema faecavium]
MLLYNVRLVDECSDCRGALCIRDGLIHSVHQGVCAQADARRLAAALADTELIDGGSLVLMPSFIDMHAHFRYPGQPEKETLETGLRAAAAGGFGTLVLMPNTVPVVSSAADALSVQRDAAAYGLADVYQSMSITAGFDGETTAHLEEIPLDRASASFIPLVTEDGRDVASAAVLFSAMQCCAVRGVVVSCHSEDASLALQARAFRRNALALLARGGDEPCRIAENALRQANELLALAEDTATERNLLAAEAAGCRVHIAHVSTARALDAVRRAKRRRPAMVTCEVTPHHLALCAESAQTLRALVNPPLRSEADRQAVIEALCDGTVNVIATDHAPHTAADKAAGAPGFSGLETAFGVCCTQLVHAGHMTLCRLSRLMSAEPARILGLDRGPCPKGRLLPGYAADAVLADPDAEWSVNAAAFESRGKATPFDKALLTGKVRAVLRRGRFVYRDADAGVIDTVMRRL